MSDKIEELEKDIRILQKMLRQCETRMKRTALQYGLLTERLATAKQALRIKRKEIPNDI
jgi:hypothetical protein